MLFIVITLPCHETTKDIFKIAGKLVDDAEQV